MVEREGGREGERERRKVAGESVFFLYISGTYIATHALERGRLTGVYKKIYI